MKRPDRDSLCGLKSLLLDLSRLTIACTLCELRLFAKCKLVVWQVARRWLCPTNVILDKQAVRAFAQEDSLCIRLECRVAHLQFHCKVFKEKLTLFLN